MQIKKYGELYVSKRALNKSQDTTFCLQVERFCLKVWRTFFTFEIVAFVTFWRASTTGGRCTLRPIRMGRIVQAWWRVEFSGIPTLPADRTRRAYAAWSILRVCVNAGRRTVPRFALATRAGVVFPALCVAALVYSGATELSSKSLCC